MGRKISQAGIKLIKSFEGCRLKAYKPVPTEQYWTIGWGHYGPDVKEGMTITRAEADEMFLKDLEEYEAAVNRLTVELNQNQYDALVSFAYNCGVGSLMKLCLGRTLVQIAQAIPLYNKGGGKVLAGLVRRRQEELELFNKKIVADPAQGGDNLELTNYQWGILLTQVKGLLDSGTISDKTWTDKIEKKTLTVSELAWLAFIVAKK